MFNPRLVDISAKNYTAGFSIIVLCFIVFFKTFTSDFVNWDDNVLVLENPILKLSFLNALKNSFSVYFHGDFLPVTIMSYWADFQMSGLSSAFMHTENLILHTMSCLLLLRLLIRLSKNPELSFLIVLVFAVHPVQTESVMWISERKGLLSGLFIILSMTNYFDSLKKNRFSFNYYFSLLLYVAAALTKASGILVPILFLVFEILHSENSCKSRLARLSPFIGVGILLVLLRIHAYSSGVGISGGEILMKDNWIEMPVRSLQAIGIYFKMFFYPVNLSAIYPGFELTTLSVFNALATAFGAGVLTWRIVREKNSFRIVSWIWFVIFLAPVLHFFPRINYVNDRYLYLPIVGLAGLLLSYLNSKYYRVVGVLLLLLMGSQSIAFSTAWVNSLNLWSNVLRVYPDSNIALSNHAMELQKIGQLDNAAAEYEKVINSGKDSSTQNLAYNNLANIYGDPKFKYHSMEKTIELLQAGIQKSIKSRDTYEMRTNLGMALRATNQISEARVVLGSLLEDLRNESDYRFKKLIPLVESNLQAMQLELK